MSTGLEWRLLTGNPNADLADWRSSFTGSVLTSRCPTSNNSLPQSVSEVLRRIHGHPSKAAQTYYYQFFRNYFVGVQNAIENISASSRIEAQGLFVIQDSLFKDITVPLTSLFSDMLQANGWRVDRIEPFSIAPTFYKINTRRWVADRYIRTENVIWATRVDRC
jgi:hypothetical protein